MVALRRGGFVLALFDEGSPFIRELGLSRYRPLFIGLNMPADEILGVRARLAAEDWDEESGGFRDRYGIGWQLGAGTFLGTGDRTGALAEHLRRIQRMSVAPSPSRSRLSRHLHLTENGSNRILDLAGRKNHLIEGLSCTQQDGRLG